MALKRSVLPIATIAAALICGAGQAALAQQQEPQQPSPPGSQTPQPSAVDDKDIRAFVAAASEVEQLKEEWIPKVAEATRHGPEAERKVRQQAFEEMVQAVQEKGLTVKRYQEIYELAQIDPEVQRKVREHLLPDSPDGNI